MVTYGTVMTSETPATTIRLTAEDRDIIDRLRKATGLTSGTAVIRLALREALAAREAPRRKR
jgi:hypothetical protein